jgi:hypothetical protein
LKKVLIISYFYPPANFVGSSRAASFAKHLHKFNVYPVIVTRNWNDGQKDIVGKVLKNELQIEKFETHEVHRLPYPYTLRDRCASYRFLKPFQKMLTLFELIFSNFSIRVLPYRNFYKYCKGIITNDPSVDTVIASARPFEVFAIGSKLKKELDIRWIPDYRDEWTTRATEKPKGIIANFLYFLQRKSEKKWTSNADSFITVSDHWKNNIQKFIEIKGSVVKNGFEGNRKSIDSISSLKSPKKDGFKIIYVGAIYPYQPIQHFIDLVIEVSRSHKIEVLFIGTSPNLECDPSLYERIKDYPEVFKISKRLEQERLNDLLLHYDISLGTNYGDLKGCIPVKFYDYFLYDLPIFLYPSDNDVMEEFLQKTQSGYAINNKTEAKRILIQLIEEKESKEKINSQRNITAGLEYSRSHQTSILAKYLDQLK